MKCQHCGAENPDTARFCRECGKTIEQEQPDTKASNSVPTAIHRDTVCPHCGGENCQPMMRNVTKIKNSGYSWTSGCCGMLLMGPFGLLCGLCSTGSKVDTKNETVWVCQTCGKEHLSQKSALDRAQIRAASYVMPILLIALLLSGWYHNGNLPWPIPLTWAFSPLFAWGIIDDEVSKELGYPFKEMLPPDLSVGKYLVIAEAATILVLLFGGPIVTSILSEL